MKVEGEYYVSLAYKFICMKYNSVIVYPLQHFMQWGTPEDVAEYKCRRVVVLAGVVKATFRQACHDAAAEAQRLDACEARTWPDLAPPLTHSFDAAVLALLQNR